MKKASKKVIKIILGAVAAMMIFAGMAGAEVGQIGDNTGINTVIFSEDFESGWNGSYADNGIWQVGTPTAGPTGCYSGLNCSGTNLNGNYPPDTDSSLISPSIQIPVVGAGEEVHLRFWQWFSYAANDVGYIQVSVYNASTGLWETPENAGRPIWQTSPYWSFTDRELTKYAGKLIKIVFEHTASSAYPYGESTGWYIDDIEITKSVPVFTGDFESGWGDWFADKGVWQVGTPTAGPTGCYSGLNCSGTNLNGNYPPDTDSSLISPSIQIPVVGAGEEVHLRFWQWFSYADNDAGYIQVSVYNASTGLWETPEKVGKDIVQISPYWSFTDRELTKYAGKLIKIVFEHTASSAYPYGESTGWYIDDVVITNRRYDLNRNGIPADAGDLILMKQASIGEITSDIRYDLNDNDLFADAGDLVLMKRASIGEILP